MNKKSTLKFGVAILTLICAFCAMNFALAKPSNVPLDADSAVIRTYFAPLGPKPSAEQDQAKKLSMFRTDFYGSRIKRIPCGQTRPCC